MTYECTVTGQGGATIWRGTAINCSETGNEIAFRHNTGVFTSVRGCSGRTIIGRGIRIEPGYVYTSQLNITVYSSAEKKLECTYENGNSSVIGTLPVVLTTGNEIV